MTKTKSKIFNLSATFGATSLSATVIIDADYAKLILDRISLFRDLIRDTDSHIYEMSYWDSSAVFYNDSGRIRSECGLMVICQHDVSWSAVKMHGDDTEMRTRGIHYNEIKKIAG